MFDAEKVTSKKRLKGLKNSSGLNLILNGATNHLKDHNHVWKRPCAESNQARPEKLLGRSANSRGIPRQEDQYTCIVRDTHVRLAPLSSREGGIELILKHLHVDKPCLVQASTHAFPR